jgi:NOL1/NOP2/fmu family ribosome biogenesis protein
MRRRGSSETVSPQDLSGRVFDYLEQRFGLARELFDGYGLYLASKGRIYIGPKRVPDMPKIATIGLLAARSGGTIKPSTNLLQAFGRHITRNLIDLTKEQALEYARGSDVKASAAQASGAHEGYVLMRYEGIPLGCGLLQLGTIKNMLPKAKRLSIRHI